MVMASMCLHRIMLSTACRRQRERQSALARERERARKERERGVY
jgi:hypothetical protein